MLCVQTTTTSVSWSPWRTQSQSPQCHWTPTWRSWRRRNDRWKVLSNHTPPHNKNLLLGLSFIISFSFSSSSVGFKPPWPCCLDPSPADQTASPLTSPGSWWQPLGFFLSAQPAAAMSSIRECSGCTPSLALWHFPPNFARIGYTTEGGTPYLHAFVRWCCQRRLKSLGSN